MTSIVLGLASAHAQGEVNISPIVQVISYSDSQKYETDEN